MKNLQLVKAALEAEQRQLQAMAQAMQQAQAMQMMNGGGMPPQMPSGR
jgi:hypothetical protein